MATSDSEPPETSRFEFIREGLLTPARNPGLFGPIWVLIIAETALQIPSLNSAQHAVLAAATSLLTSMTTAAAVVTRSVHDIEHDDAPGFGQVLAGVYGTAVLSDITADVCWAALAVLGSLVESLVRYTRSLLVLDLLILVLHAAELAETFLGVVVLPVAVAVAAFEPGCHRVAALRRAFWVTAENVDKAVVFILAKGVVASMISPWNTTASRYPVEWLYVLLSGTLRMFSVCVVTAFYRECKHRSQMDPANWWQLIATGKEWVTALPLRCSDGLQETLQGTISIRHVLLAMVVRVRTWSVWVLFFVSNHPWVASVLVISAGRLISEGPTSVFYQNGTVGYRNYLKGKYHIHHTTCE